MKRDLRIQIARILSMIMIVVCHFSQIFANKYIVMSGQFFNVGVYIFFIISGYLYANRKIECPVKWFFSKMFKLLIPVYIFMIYIFISNIYINNVFDIKNVFIYLLNLQGMFKALNGAGHFWFLTSLMFCYLALPILQSIKKEKSKFLIILLTMIAIIIAFINEYISQQIFYIITFYLGMYLKNRSFNKEKNSIYKYLIIITLTFVFRIISRELFDESILYNIIITSTTHMIISTAIFIYIINSKINIKSRKIINYFDNLSFYIYICHYTLIIGPIKSINLTNNIIFNIFWTLLLIFIIANILSIITKKIIRFLENKNLII